MKRHLQGKVIADALDKTRVIEIIRDVVHPLYKKRYKVAKKFYAHDANNSSKIGDQVVIEEMRPLSKLKRWKVVERIGANTAVVEREERAHSQEQDLPGERGKGKRRVPSRKGDT